MSLPPLPLHSFGGLRPTSLAPLGHLTRWRSATALAPLAAIKRVIGARTAVYQGTLLRVTLAAGKDHPTTLPEAPLGEVVQSKQTPLLRTLMDTAVGAKGRFLFNWTKGAERFVSGYNYSALGVNGKPFRGPGHVSRTVQLGAVEEWSIGGLFHHHQPRPRG